jgi:hypothetical protein
MKNTLLLLTVFIIFFNASAQISITQYDMPLAGNVYLYFIDPALVSEDFSQTGASHNWDFSQSGTTSNDTLTISTVSSTPIAYQLYFNNSFLYPQHKANYTIKGADFDGFGQVTIENRYDFFKVNPGSLEIVGFGANVNTIPASVRYDTIDKIYHFPMQYLDVDYSVGFFLTTIPTLGTYGSHINRTIEVDGWGSITTPTKTYPNALRVKTTLTIEDTVFVDQFSFGTTVNRPIEIRYEWWTNEDNSPVMIALSNAGQITQVKYLAPITSYVDEIINSDFKIIPTTNENVFTLKGEKTQEIKEVFCFDASGRVVEIEWNPTQNSLTFPDKTKQLVFITFINSEGQQITLKLVK